MALVQQTKGTTAVDLGSLLGAGDGNVVTVQAGDTRLAAHRAVLVDRSPVFSAMFRHDTLEAGSSEVSIPDVEGAVLRQLLAFLYTLQAPQLPDMASPLLVAADKYGVSALKAACEQQVAAQLSVETAAAAAVLAVRHSCESLRKTAIDFVRANFVQVTRTQGWADAIRMQPEDVIEVSRLLSDPPAESRPIQQTKETTAVDLGSLLGAGDGAVVTLVAGDTRLAAHRAVLERSPVFAAMFGHDTLEAGSGEVSIPDVEGAVLRQLLAFLYTLQAPQLPGMASSLLAAADKYGVSALKAACEQQVAAQLSVETAAATAVLAVGHSCDSLRKTAIDFVKANLDQVMVSQGWADAIRMQPEEVVKVTRLLFNSPAETRSLNDKEKGRLIEAAKQGAVAELEALLAAGADVAATDGARMTALHRAAREGHVEAARWLVARGALVDARCNVHWTPLHEAAKNGHTAVVRLLLAASAYHSAREDNGRTPLHMAADCGHAEVAAALLEAGADREARNNSGEKPLDTARQKNKQQLVDLLSGR